MNGSPAESKPLEPYQKILLTVLAVLYSLLIVFWVFNNMNRPLLGVGAVENFNRMPPPVAATANMTWRFAPGLGHLAVVHRFDPLPAASKIQRLEQIGTGANGATIYRASYLSDSVVVYGVLGVPAQTPSPAVVVCHPSDTPYQTGLHTLDTVKHLAEIGLLAFAPDYRGWGPSGGQRGNEVKDVLNALATLRADAGVTKGKIGLIGYSMGGGIAARAAAVDPDLSILVLYYAQMMGSLDELRSGMKYAQFEIGSGGIQQFIQEGRNNGADDAEMEYALKMISPIYHLADFKGRVVAFHGAKDNVVSIRQSEGLEKEMRRLGIKVELIAYPELSHAFANSVENPSKEQLAKVLKEALLG